MRNILRFSLIFVIISGGFLFVRRVVNASIGTTTQMLPPTSSMTSSLSAAYIKAMQAKIVVLQYKLKNEPAAPYIFTNRLALGSTDSDVRALQKFFNMQGYFVARSGPGSPGNETTYFGSGTKEAVIRFQISHHILPATGILESRTMALINPNYAPLKIVASSSRDIFSYPHGIAQIGDRMVIGTIKDSPGRIVVFNDPNDLTRFITTSTPGYANLADADYDTSHHKFYFVSSRIDNNHLEVLSVDPDTLTWNPVFEFADVTGIGYSTLQTDGSYVYVGTQSIPAYMLKIRVSDWSLVDFHSFPDLPGFHSSILHTYSNRTEWYVNTFSIPTIFFKVNTDDFSYTSTTITRGGDVTNDIYFRPIDDAGGLVYNPSENVFGMDVVNTAHMSDTHYDSTPGSYGLFSDGADLYSMDAHDHLIIKYPEFNIQKPLYLKLPRPYNPNEWFKTSNGNTYFTVFDNPSALYQYTFSFPQK